MRHGCLHFSNRYIVRDSLQIVNYTRFARFSRHNSNDQDVVIESSDLLDGYMGFGANLNRVIMPKLFCPFFDNID